LSCGGGKKFEERTSLGEGRRPRTEKRTLRESLPREGDGADGWELLHFIWKLGGKNGSGGEGEYSGDCFWGREGEGPSKELGSNTMDCRNWGVLQEGGKTEGGKGKRRRSRAPTTTPEAKI